jgi:hypothetical protein
VSLICWVCTERGKVSVDTPPLELLGWRERERINEKNSEILSTDAAFAGGPARSSGEASVMGVERRGWLIFGFVHESNWSARVGQEETSGHVRLDG